jgi:xeroderma pigmentosum group C-complementing protein
LREGKQIKAEEQPVKMTKVKRMTVQRQRLMEKSKQDEMRGIIESTEELDMNGLFGEWQTEWYQPLSVVDGKIPKNSFGNVEIFHERMIPVGTIFLKGILKDSLMIRNRIW